MYNKISILKDSGVLTITSLNKATEGEFGAKINGPFGIVIEF
jgi:hypothetical protein